MRLRVPAAAAVIGILLSASAASAANVLRWASQGDALTLDPHAQNEGPTLGMVLNIMEPLVRSDAQLKFEPALAETWRAVAPTVWEFKLRHGVRFHDGDDFDAQDVVFSLDRARSKGSDLKDQLSSIVEVKRIDGDTIQIVTSGPNPILPNQLVNVAIMSKEWAEKHGVQAVQDYKNRQETFAVRNANGTGPFKLKLREPDTRTVLVRNDDWWGLAKWPTNVDEIVYTPIVNPATRVAALLSGELDFLLDPPLQDLARIKATPGLKTADVAQNRTMALGMDERSPELRSSDVKGRNPFADVRVRQAVYQAIDIKAIQAKIMRGQSEPAGSLLPPYITGWTEALRQRLPFDNAAAKKLMAEAGYPDGFSVRLDCPNDRYLNDEAICQAVVGMLGKVGIKVSLDARTKSRFFPSLQKRETDFYLFGWGVPTLDAQFVFDALYRTNGTWNVPGYANPEFDRLLREMATELDPERRHRLIAEASDIVRTDIVYIPLHYGVITWAMRDRLTLPIIPSDQPQFRYARLN